MRRRLHRSVAVFLPNLRMAQDGSGADAFDPFFADLVMQAMLIWAREMAGAAALPGDGLLLQFLRPVPRASRKGAIVTMTRTRGSTKDAVWRASFFVHSDDGTVYMRGEASVVLSTELAYDASRSVGRGGAECLIAEMGTGSASVASSAATVVAQVAPAPTAVAGTSGVCAAPATESKTSSMGMESAKACIMEEVSTATGYETSMIDEEMSLEEELGIDSIKRVEILSACQERLGLEVQDVERLSRTRTVGDVIECLIAEIVSSRRK